jgi:hypothetical protein
MRTTVAQLWAKQRHLSYSYKYGGHSIQTGRNSNYNAGECSENARYSGKIVGYTAQITEYKVNVRERAASYGAKQQNSGYSSQT